MDYENSDRNNEWEKVRAEVLHELRADESSRLEPQGINYTAFISMTTSTALLSARVSDCFVNDAKRIMSLLGKAYGLAETESERYIDSILGVMMCIASPKDYKTFQALRGGDNVLDCEDMLFDIKGSVLDSIMASRARGLYVGPAGNGEMQRVAYNARMSCIKLCDIAATGDVLCSRQVSIMRYLGIGCEKNVERAINGFIECAYWGDATSVKLLHACLCEQNMDVSIIRDYEAIASRYWYDTPLLAPRDALLRYSPESIALYRQAALICRNIVRGGGVHDIDRGFVEVLRDPGISNADKEEFINNYAAGIWRSASSVAKLDSNRTIGF